MSISLGVVLLILFLSIFLSDNKKSRDTFLVIIAIILIVQNAFRPIEMTIKTSNDTYRYLLQYNEILNESWSSLLANLSFHSSDYLERDKGYSIFVKATQLIAKDFSFFLCVVAIIIVIPIIRIIRKFVPTKAGIVSAILIYEALFAHFFETGIRQTVAMGFLLMGFNWALERKWIKFTCLVLAASTIHTSSVVFLPLPFLSFIKKPRKMVLYMLLLVPFLMLSAKDIIAVLGAGTMYSGYAIDSEHNQGTPVFSMFIVLIGLTTYWAAKKIQHYYPDNSNFLILTMGVTVMLMPATWVDSNFIRLTFYYAIFILPTIPLCIESMFHNSRQSKLGAYVVINCVMLFLMMT